VLELRPPKHGVVDPKRMVVTDEGGCIPVAWSLAGTLSQRVGVRQHAVTTMRPGERAGESMLSPNLERRPQWQRATAQPAPEMSITM
jgi:hypothetical protein